MGYGKLYETTWWVSVCQFYPWGYVYYDIANCGGTTYILAENGDFLIAENSDNLIQE